MITHTALPYDMAYMYIHVHVHVRTCMSVTQVLPSEEYTFIYACMYMYMCDCVHHIWRRMLLQGGFQVCFLLGEICLKC